jgi:hypothetical protein
MSSIVSAIKNSNMTTHVNRLLILITSVSLCSCIATLAITGSLFISCQVVIVVLGGLFACIIAFYAISVYIARTYRVKERKEQQREKTPHLSLELEKKMEKALADLEAMTCGRTFLEISIAAEKFEEAVRIMSVCVKYLLSEESIESGWQCCLSFVLDENKNDKLSLSILAIDDNKICMDISLSSKEADTSVHSERFRIFLEEFDKEWNKKSFPIHHLVFNVPGLNFPFERMEISKFARYEKIIIRGNKEEKSLLKGILPEIDNVYVYNCDLCNVLVQNLQEYKSINLLSCGGNLIAARNDIQKYIQNDDKIINMCESNIELISATEDINSVIQAIHMMEDAIDTTKSFFTRLRARIGSMFLSSFIDPSVNYALIHEIFDNEVINTRKKKISVSPFTQIVYICNPSQEKHHAKIDENFAKKFQFKYPLKYSTIGLSDNYNGNFQFENAHLIFDEKYPPTSRFEFKNCTVEFHGINFGNIPDVHMYAMDGCEVIFSNCTMGDNLQCISASRSLMPELNQLLQIMRQRPQVRTSNPMVEKITFKECKFPEGMQMDLLKADSIYIENCVMVNGKNENSIDFSKIKLIADPSERLSGNVSFVNCHLTGEMTATELEAPQDVKSTIICTINNCYISEGKNTMQMMKKFGEITNERKDRQSEKYSLTWTIDAANIYYRVE